MTVVINAYRTEKTRSIRVRTVKYNDNGEVISRTTEKPGDVQTTRAMVEMLRKSNARAVRIHVKYGI